MLFLCKRSVSSSIVVLAALLGLALLLRRTLATGPLVEWSLPALATGLVVYGLVLLSDGLLHQSFRFALGEPYRERFHELAEVFRKQSAAAMFAGALLAGLGEEAFFRGIGTDPVILALGAVMFGLLHHIRRRLWLFTLWAGYEGFLFAAALYVTQNLAVTMVAHFLHDLTGFGIFRRERGRIPCTPYSQRSGRSPDTGSRGVGNTTAGASPPREGAGQEAAGSASD
jgi:membrane protease YdiL (CAAX protease family)